MKIGNIEIQTIDMVTFLGMMITLFTSVLNLFQNKKSIYINNITKYRVTWLDDFKKHISKLKELSNITNLYIISRNVKDKMNFRCELERNIMLIKMHLNFSKNLDRKVINDIEIIKAIINNYLLLNYCIYEIDNINDDILLEKFIVILETINEKCFLKELIKLSDKKQNINIDELNILQLKQTIKDTYDNNIIKNIKINGHEILQRYENELEIIQEELDEVIQIYLKIEWIKCKKETRMWPFTIYDEDKEIEKLYKKYRKQDNLKMKKWE